MRISNNEELNFNYLKVQKDINIRFNRFLTKKIRVGIYTYSLKNGGLQKLTSLIIKYFLEQKIYDLYIYNKVLYFLDLLINIKSNGHLIFSNGSYDI